MLNSSKEFIRIIHEHDNIVFFGGAGVSTESNIPDFRGTCGLTHLKLEYTFEEILSIDFLYNHTDIFYDFYKKHMIYPNAQPNPAHFKLAELENKGKIKSIITQNIDGLHQKAGENWDFCNPRGFHYFLPSNGMMGHGVEEYPIHIKEICFLFSHYSKV